VLFQFNFSCADRTVLKVFSTAGRLIVRGTYR